MQLIRKVNILEKQLIWSLLRMPLIWRARFLEDTTYLESFLMTQMLWELVLANFSSDAAELESSVF